jgi:DNA-binding XRE family transcriptional regulator
MGRRTARSSALPTTSGSPERDYRAVSFAKSSAGHCSSYGVSTATAQGTRSALCAIITVASGVMFVILKFFIASMKTSPCSLPKLTGYLFRAGRALAGLTRDDLANRAGLSRDVLRTWEVSSDSIVPAQYQMLCRAIEALEDAGVRFSDGGVSSAAHRADNPADCSTSFGHRFF